MHPTSEFQERIGRIEALVKKLEAADPASRRSATELVEALMELHGAGLDRILELLSKSIESGIATVRELAEDELVGSLLVLYGLHPDDFETRARRGLDKAATVLRSRGAHLDQIVIGEGTVLVRIAGAESGGLEGAVREALLATAPDATEVVIESQGARQHAGFVPLSALAMPAVTKS